ncbi:MAG: type VI secretion system baseplate subunit TssF, partial [Gammaproteobacteria bacterium]|nr:type VI secretion system baseplate subunit TssF [Gammaproteobacteria bacterium]
MEFNKYYQEELAYLRDMGDAFSHHYPKLAPFLAYDSNDPDVERLLEGFSFLTAKLRQKLDDEVPEFTTGLFTSLWPHFLRPVPAMSIMEFTPLESAVVGKKVVPVGSEIESKAVEGTRCSFRTSYDVEILPINISTVSVKNYSKKGQLFVEIKSTNGQM